MTSHASAGGGCGRSSAMSRKISWIKILSSGHFHHIDIDSIARSHVRGREAPSAKPKSLGAKPRGLPAGYGSSHYVLIYTIHSVWMLNLQKSREAEASSNKSSFFSPPPPSGFFRGTGMRSGVPCPFRKLDVSLPDTVPQEGPLKVHLFDFERKKLDTRAQKPRRLLQG